MVTSFVRSMQVNDHKLMLNGVVNDENQDTEYFLGSRGRTTH